MEKRTNELNHSIIEGIKAKKGEDIVLIDLTNIEFAVTDYFVICHANSNRQVDSIAENVRKKVKAELNESVSHSEGEQSAEWILLDYLNTVVHIFKHDVRETYQLEELWGDGEITRYNSEK